MLNHNKFEYDRNNALFLGSMAQLVYEPWFSVDKGLYDLKIENWAKFDVGNTEAFIAEWPNSIVICFRGTDCLEDWISDFDFKKVKEGKFKAHRGFVKALDLVWKDILHYLQNANSNKSIWVTGHSLGGGLSTIASCRLRELYIDHITYVYGCPRAISLEYSDWYERNFPGTFHRTTNNNDIVCRVPFRGLNFGHLGGKAGFHYYREDGEQDDNISWGAKLLDRIEGRLKDIGKLGTDGIKDHSIKEYIERLIKNNT